MDAMSRIFPSLGHMLAGAVLVLAVAAGATTSVATPIKIVALGDSLTAGYGLAADEAFPAKLQAALKARGHDVEVVNAGVSGDTSKGGLARLDWSVGPDADAVILELGANDMLRGINPIETRDNLDAIMQRLSGRGLPVLIGGMYAAPNMGSDYAARFKVTYPFLAEKYDALLYPFFLDGVAGKPSLVQSDGMHPTAAGVDTIVEGILPLVEQLIVRVRKDS